MDEAIPQLTTEIVMVMVMITVAVFLFVVEWVRVDVVGILMMVSLPLLGLISSSEAFIGLSSNAVVSIIAVIIIGAGLDKTGLVNRVVVPVVKLAGNSTSRVIIAISVTVSMISSFMQNIGAAALFLPAIKRISKTLRIPISRILMPVGFCAILGGTVTMVGSSPLILLNDLIRPYDLKPFHLFAVTPIGLALVASGIAYFVLFGKYVLPDGNGPHDDSDDAEPHDIIKDWYAFIGDPYEISVPDDYTPSEEQLNLSQIRRKYMVNIVAMTGPDEIRTLAPSRHTELLPGNHFGLYATKENIRRFVKEEELHLKESLDLFTDTLSPSMSGTIEAVVGPHSSMVGKSLQEVHFRKQYRVTPLAIHRGNKVLKTHLSEVILRSGDAILFHGSWERFKILQKNNDFIITTHMDHEVLRPEKALFAAMGLIISLGLVITLKVVLSVALMTGALFIILTRVLSIDEAYRSVDWRTVFLLAGLIPLGIATEKTGAAAWFAHQILATLGDVSPIVLLTIIALLSTAFTLVISNVGATVLLVPLVVNMALDAGVDPRMAALVVGVATSNSFLLPTHQVNALYMGPGRYRSIDFIKAGSLQSIIFLVVLIASLYLFYGVSAKG